jgi:hypothetical protein
MKLIQKVFAFVLILTMTVGLVFEASAAGSPSSVPTPANPGFDATSSTDTNVQDHPEAVVVSKVGTQTAAVTSIESAGTYAITLSVARDQDNEEVPITSIEAGALGSKQGRMVSTLNIDSAKKVTVKSKALKGSKVRSLKVYNKKIAFNKQAFKGTRVKSLKIYLKTAKKSSDVKVQAGAFEGLSTNARIYVNKKMSKTEFNKLKAKLEKAGFKGKIIRK